MVPRSVYLCTCFSYATSCERYKITINWLEQPHNTQSTATCARPRARRPDSSVALWSDDTASPSDSWINQRDFVGVSLTTGNWWCSLGRWDQVECQWPRKCSDCHGWGKLAAARQSPTKRKRVDDMTVVEPGHFDMWEWLTKHIYSSKRFKRCYLKHAMPKFRCFFPWKQRGWVLRPTAWRWFRTLVVPHSKWPGFSARKGLLFAGHTMSHASSW